MSTDHTIASPGLAGRSLTQVTLPASDLPRAVAFYQDVLGLPLLFESNGMAFFQLANLRLMIGRQEPGRTAIGPGVIYFEAPDLETLGTELEGRGATFRGPAETVQRTADGELKLRFLLDPDGNMIGLMGLVAAGA